MYSGMEQKNANLPKEVLQSLFSVPERSEEPKKTRIGIGLNRTRVVGKKPVKEPLEDLYSSSTMDHPIMMHDVNSGMPLESQLFFSCLLSKR